VLDRERLLRQVIDLVPHYIFAKDSQSRLLLVNRAFAAAHGLTVEQMIGRRDSECMSDQAQAEAFRRDDLEVIEGGRPKFIPEERLTLKDGGVRILETIKIPFAMPGQSGPALLAVAVDITERKAAEQQLQQMAVIVESSEEAIIGSNLAGVITSWNHGAEVIFGYGAAEIVGLPDLNLFPPDLQAEHARILDRIGHSEGFRQLHTERVRKDGKRIRISASISPVKDGHGNVVGAATIANDITRHQLLEEQLRQSQKMEAIGQLAGGVAHDFNNILAVIQMQIELAQMDAKFTPEQELCLAEIQTAAKRGANLTRQLLLFSRRQRLQPRELDLGDSIANMTKMLRRILGEDIQIQFKYAPQPVFILADAGMIDQVLMNLTLNSRDAMPAGGHLVIETATVEMDELAVLQSPQARPGSFVRLSVSDTGSGIAPEILPRIFEPFFTTKDVGKGTGLGLATVFSIVQQHQGWIHVSSEPGGTTFDIYFPRLLKAPGQPPEAPPTLASAAGGSETILLVEDDDALRASVHRCLAELGYRCFEAATGVAALGLWQDHGLEINLLLSDLILPGGLTGKELGQRLQQKNPKLKIVFVSGYSADTLTGGLQPGGRVQFLAKPFAAQTLARTVRACLDEN
jgi:PAS domain S-box-containing protein